MVFKNAGFASLKIDFPRDFGIPPPCRGEPGLTCLRALGLPRQAVDTKVPALLPDQLGSRLTSIFANVYAGQTMIEGPTPLAARGVVLPDGVQTRGPTALYSSLP